jgi:hypothetical protein
MPNSQSKSYEEWIKLSHSIGRPGWNEINFLVPIIQHLARMDCDLDAQDKIFGGLRERELSGYDPLLFDHYAWNSYVWVLISYEMVRTLSSYAKEAESPLYKKLSLIQNTKRAFEELRIPLAKHELAERFSGKRGIKVIPWPVLMPEGVGWRIGEQRVISRSELSVVLFDLFTEISSS